MQLSRIDLNLLVLFDAVFSTRHVGRAAEKLKLSPSAVSHGLTRLRRLLNDPLFLKAPKGVVPTAAALTLAGPVSEILAQVRNVVAMTESFDPEKTSRRFVIGALAGTSSVVVTPLVAYLRKEAPGISLTIRETRAATTFDELDDRIIDVAITHLGGAPARFDARLLYEEHFVVAMRMGHALAGGMTLTEFTQNGAILVSPNAEAAGFVDDALTELGLSRRIVVVAPGFLSAFALLAETDLHAVVPERMAALHAGRYAIVTQEPPLPLPRFKIQALAPKAALKDRGLQWLLQSIEAVSRGLERPAERPRRRAGDKGARSSIDADLRLAGEI